MKLREKFSRNLMSGNFTKNIFLAIPRLIKKCIKKFDLYIQVYARRHFGKKIEVENNKILFINFQGNYTCNQKAIAEEIIRQKLPIKMVFTVSSDVAKNPSILDNFPPHVKPVTRGTYDFFKEVASSKIWIDNSINMEYLNAMKKDNQVIIETWHGSLGLKKMTADSVLDKKWVKKAKKYGKKTDYCISNSEFETECVYKANYWENSEILEYGHPRNDILFRQNSEEAKSIIDKVRKLYNISDDKKILLYAPTFREDKSLDYYNIDYKKLKESLQKKFGGEWVILIKMHFKLRKLVYRTSANDGIINATDYPDIQDLILACDMGITDYSSWICDLVLTKKPGFLYTPDIDSYNKERGLFYPLSETPFPISKNNKELIKNIMDFDIDKYEKKRGKFLKLRGCIEDGKASERTVEKIKEIMKL